MSAATPIPPSLSIDQQFRQYADELQSSQDEYERVYKQNRDITIESKRIIGLLQTVNDLSGNKPMQQAHKRLHSVVATNFRTIARLLSGQDPYRFIRAYKCGIQEFIEAFVLYSLMDGAAEPLPDWNAMQTLLTYNISSSEKCDDQQLACQIEVTPLDYVLGVADVSGELMRRCIHSLSRGDFVACKRIADQMRAMYTG